MQILIFPPSAGEKKNFQQLKFKTEQIIHSVKLKTEPTKAVPSCAKLLQTIPMSSSQASLSNARQAIAPSGLSWSTSASSLHLDDLQENHNEACNARPETCRKRKEHFRLFKEYLECCQDAIVGKDAKNFNSQSFSNLSICGEDLSTDGQDCRDPAAGEYGSFLPKVSSSPKARQSQSSYTKAESSPFPFKNGGRDAPASSRREQVSACGNKAPATPPTTLSHSSSTASVVALKDSRASLTALPACLDAEEGSVYRAQIAAALGAGRVVWL